MAAEVEIHDPASIDLVLPDLSDSVRKGNGDVYVVILYNDDHHSMDEVVLQLMRATHRSVQQCIDVMFEAHQKGRAIAFSGTSVECERVAGILRQIRLQVETDRY